MDSPYSTDRPTSNGWYYVKARYEPKHRLWLHPGPSTAPELVWIEGADKPHSMLNLSTRGAVGTARKGVLYGPAIPSAQELAKAQRAPSP